MASKKKAKKKSKKKAGARSKATSKKKSKAKKKTKPAARKKASTGKKKTTKATTKRKASSSARSAAKSAKPASSALAAGQSLQDRSVLLGDGREAKLSSLSGSKGLVLYFYPRDNTPGCTREACSFRDNLSELNRVGFNVAGVSPDSSRSHENFRQKYDLNFPLIADEDKGLARAFGVYGEKKLYGKTYMGIVRSTFVLDRALKILLAYPNVKVDGHVEEILADVANRA